jgi:hypothetical protein
MADTRCRNFFLQPTQTLHRRYEALRAFFVDHRPLLEIAQEYGYRYGSLRNLVARFRAQCCSGHVPPFLLPHLMDVPAPSATVANRPSRSRPSRPMAANFR